VTAPAAVELARRLALLGAEAAVAERRRDDLVAGAPFRDHAARFRILGAELAAWAESGDPMRVRLRDRLGLSEAGTWLVALCAAAERHPEAAAALSILADDERVALVTPAAFARLAATALAIPFERALEEAVVGGPAERLGLVERVEGAGPRPWAAQPLRLTAREARVQLAGDAPDLDATSLAVDREPPAPAPAFAAPLVGAAAALLAEGGALCLRARSARAARQLALDLAAARGEPALLVRGGEEPPEVAEVGRLRGGLVAVELFGACHARGFPEPWVRELSGRLPAVAVLVPASAQTGQLPTIEVPELEPEVARRAWAAVPEAREHAAALAGRFRVSLDEARAAVRAAVIHKRLHPNGSPVPALEDVAAEVRAQGARRMGRVVSVVPPHGSLHDLVVPAAVRAALDDLLAFHRAAPTVWADPALARSSTLGRGLSCLFSGPPGTGKTFAAQCLAHALGLNLYRIDLSQVVSKYIGETEKALARIFEEAEAGHGILLFDEADALFGKRSEVKDAHDRYANVEVAYLLQRMESFEGISVLTTNMRASLDAAFVRRLRFIVEFPVPDRAARARLWEQSLPLRDRWEAGLELSPFVDRFGLCGGDIHNIGVAAAHLAAADGGTLRVGHLVRATFRELEKAGVSRARSDFGPLARHLPAGVP
jgi:hypothetical protein